MGSCKFTGGSGEGGVAILGANQVVKTNAAEAAAVAQSIRKNVPAGGRIVNEPKLGQYGFYYIPKASAAANSRLSALYAGHYKHVAITGQIVMPVNRGFERSRDGATEFMRAALAVADNPAATDAATRCPWFDDGIVRKLLPGEGFSQQTHGTKSCMAQNGQSMALMLSVMEGVDQAVAARLRDASCTWEPVAGLGEGAMIGHGCRNGNPRAILQTRQGGKLLNYAFVPKREPTAAERQLLRDLAKAVQTR